MAGNKLLSPSFELQEPHLSDEATADMEEQLRGEYRLQPGVAGPNFNNLPVFGFRAIETTAGPQITVPTAAGFNQVANRHNPGGFLYGQVSHPVRADRFLLMAAEKIMPLSVETRRTVSLKADPWRLFAGHDTRPVGRSLRVHDLLDHGGMLAITASEADKIAKASKQVVYTDSSTDKRQATRSLDALTSCLSLYALMPAQPEADGPESMFKEKLWQAIGRTSLPLSLDRDAVDAGILEMQRLGASRLMNAGRHIGRMLFRRQ